MTRGALPTDWTSSADWEAAIENSIVATDAAKYLVGVGGIAEPTETVIEGPKLQDLVVDRVYTLTLEVHNLSDIQYDALRQLQCGKTDFQFWYEDLSGNIFGGAGGITPLSVKATLPKENSRTAYDTGTVTITYSSLIDPDRAAYDGIDTTTPTTPTVQAYGPVFNGSEAYGPTAGGTEYYSFN